MLPPLIESLLDPGRYPHPVTTVEAVETHISWILLAGEFAYKIKKPVRLPFVDYGSVARRRACCEAEIRLNRRYAPDLYLDVVDFAGEPAVRMKRFDEGARLDHIARAGRLTARHLTDLARAVAAFHADAAVAPAQSRFGRPEQILAPALENFEELRRLLPAEPAALAALEAWTRDEHHRRAATFMARKQAGRVRECHGDLHLGNLVLLDGRVVPFDCIEFSDDLRWIDVASEVAFTYLDLLDHDRPGLACWLVNEWLQRTGDYPAMAVLRFYSVYRALVRAKVAALRGDDAEAAGYLRLAERLTQPPPPRLTITFGLAGAGKTTATSRLLRGDATATTVRLRSDVERKRLFGLAADADSGGAIYTPEATRRTYDRLALAAQSLLADGWSVIVDAAFLRRDERRALRALAADAGVPFVILECQAPVDELQRRLATRVGDASEATVAVLERQLGWMEPLTADELGCRQRPDDDGPGA